MALDGDVVVVVDPAEVRESQMTCQRGGLAAHALHHATVPRKGIHIESKEREVRLVVPHTKPVTCQRHANARCHPLTKRSSRRFHPGGPAIFGMSRASAFQLPKILQVIEGNRKLAKRFILPIYRFHTSQVQERIQQGGSVTRRKDESVAIRPDRIFRVEPQKFLP